MNTILPASVESYLREADFSATEMLVLRKMLEEDSFTLRELANKTGKSTGVLDQAMKKLLAKKIARKQIINGTPRFSIESLDAVVRWMHTDMKVRKAQMDRKHENLEAFIASLKLDKHRPDMQHFDGEDGIKKAYDKLLETREELLTQMPVQYLAEDDPLRDFRVEYFRKRQYHKIFQRVLAPDTPLARRFQSRDMFEYRKTLLLPESELTLTFEKTIVNGTVACINTKDGTACFLSYPELAAAEHAAFEALWARAQDLDSSEPSAALPSPLSVPLSTRILSSFRQFFLGKSSFVALGLFAIISASLTFGLYKTNRNLNLERLKDKVISIASTGALQFDAADINAIWEPSDIQKPEYAKLIATLNLIRRSNADIQYAYIMRKTNTPDVFAFVSDADSLDPYAKKDLNNDGKINNADALNLPGEQYLATEDPLMVAGFLNPVAGIAKNQWGMFVSGYAPIRDKQGTVVALLGMDVFATNLDQMTASSFAPLWAFVGFFVLFILIRYGALNRCLLGECWEAFKRNMRMTLLVLTFCIVLVVGIVDALHWYRYQLLIEQTGERLMAIAATAASDFDVDDLNQLHWARDMKTEAYQRVFRKLNEIRDKNPSVKFAYLYRPTNQDRQYEFIADADSNYNLPNLWVDLNKDGILGNADVNVWPGFYYYDKTLLFEEVKKHPAYSTDYSQWGYLISGMAPIYDSNGKLVAMFGVDVDMGEVGER